MSYEELQHGKVPHVSYTVSHHHTQCHIIIHSVTSSYTVSRHHTQCHFIIHSVHQPSQFPPALLERETLLSI